MGKKTATYYNLNKDLPIDWDPDRLQAEATWRSAQIADKVTNKYVLPEMERSSAAKNSLSPIASGFRAYLGMSSPATSSPAAQATETTPAAKATPAESPSTVTDTTGFKKYDSLIKQAAIPNNQEAVSKLLSAVQSTPGLVTWIHQNYPSHYGSAALGPVLYPLLQAERQASSATASAPVATTPVATPTTAATTPVTATSPPAATTGFDPSAFMTSAIEAPAVQTAAYNPATMPANTNAANYQTNSFAGILPLADQIAQTPGWETVGQQYANTINNAGLMGIDDSKNAANAQNTANMALRGLGGSSMSATQRQALENMANRERIALEASTLGQRLALEQGLRNEQTQAALSKAGLLQGLTSSENARIGSDAALANTIAQQNIGDWWKQNQFAQQLAAQQNQNLWDVANWKNTQQQQQQNNMLTALNYLQQDAASNINPLSAASGQTGVATSWTPLVQQRQQNDASGSTGLGSIGSLIGTAIGSPWLWK